MGSIRDCRAPNDYEGFCNDALQLYKISSFERFARECHKLGGRTTIEWLRIANHWRWPEIKRLVTDLELDAVDIDGCSFATMGTNNRFVEFPTTLKSNAKEITKRFRACRCPKTPSYRRHKAQYATSSPFINTHTPLYCDAIHTALTIEFRPKEQSRYVRGIVRTRYKNRRAHQRYNRKEITWVRALH